MLRGTGTIMAAGATETSRLDTTVFSRIDHYCGSMRMRKTLLGDAEQGLLPSLRIV
jgi:hypothetical protein